MWVDGKNGGERHSWPGCLVFVKGQKNTQRVMSQVFTFVSLLTGEFVFTSCVLGPHQLNKEVLGRHFSGPLSFQEAQHANRLIYKED